MATQTGINTSESVESVETYEFDPIQGYPMLSWKGKRPFKSTQYYPAQLKEMYGEEVDSWTNKIYWGDNLQVMSHLLKTYRGKINLIYIDPPFDSKADYKKRIELKGKRVENDRTAFEEKQYTDTRDVLPKSQFYDASALGCRCLKDTARLDRSGGSSPRFGAMLFLKITTSEIASSIDS